MKRVILLVARVAVCGVLFFCAAFSGTVSARAAEQAFVSRSAEIDGVKLRYTTGGHGPSVILLVGHDIGLMVAYAYAAQFPGEVEKLVVMDAFLPGVGEWGTVYNNPAIWHFRFNGPTPEALVHGRERLYFEYFWNDLAADRTRSLPEADRKAYAEAYARPGRMRAGWSYFVSFQQAAKLQPSNANAWFQLAQTAQQAGDSTTAVKGYKTYLKLNPDSTSANQIRQLIKQLSPHK